MNMTHYMELLAANQPWNLIFYMAIPVILAESVAISELYVLYARPIDACLSRLFNKVVGILAGLYFLGMSMQLLFTAVVPITQADAWRGPLDVVAVSAYLLSALPMIAIALMEIGVLHREGNHERKLGIHAVYVAAFLVFAHVAMIAGMADPALMGAHEPAHMQHEVMTAPVDHSAHMHH